MMTAERTHFGSVVKKGPIHSKRTRMRLAETTEAICVFPPVCSWITEREREAASGMQLKKEPTMLLRP